VLPTMPASSPREPQGGSGTGWGRAGNMTAL
jgi:hypothetical protein